METKLKQLCKYLRGHPDIEIFENEPMSRHTTFKIGGPAEVFCSLKTSNVVEKAVCKAKELGIEPFIIGNGSNLLVDDEGISGVVFEISNDLHTINGDYIVASAGKSLAKLSNVAKRSGLSGMEFACGIPGTLGGAIFMNAGAYDGEMSRIVESVTFINERGMLMTLSNESLDFGYRTSCFKKKPGCVILEAKLKLTPCDVDLIEAKMADFTLRRVDKQPIGIPSAGSVFKRPRGHFTGELIEKSGLKGFSIGGAQVSEKHAGFIVNTGNATCADVKNLISHIKETVFKNFGVELECEVQFAPNKN
ncbi:MAG: UDP-N-acetylmuramate dehydrogenase [Clostridia bacterium]|nr:UDP-N-acetylmuramate dehydrogenase [Clostridia bacterium]